MSTTRPAPGRRRARRWFWSLLVVSVVAAGSLSAALAAAPGPVTGVRVGASGVVLVVSLGLMGRLLWAVDRTRTGPRGR